MGNAKVVHLDVKWAVLMAALMVAGRGDDLVCSWVCEKVDVMVETRETIQVDDWEL